MSDAVAAMTSTETAKSAVVDELIRLNGYLNAAQAFALGQVGERVGGLRLLSILGMALLHLTFYAALARMIAPLLLPAAELRRGVLPADGAIVPARLSPVEIGVSSALVTVLFFFVALPMLAAAESWLKISTPPSRYVRIFVEEIDGVLHRPGTIERIEKLRTVIANGQAGMGDGLRKTANAGFDAMARNVDPYLDIYYSLPAEYLRIVDLVMGEDELAQRMAADLNGALMAGNPFGPYDAWTAAVLKSSAQLNAIYADGVKAVLEKTAVSYPPGTRVEVVARAKNISMALSAPTITVTNIGERAMVSAAAGGVVAALVTKKLVAKGVLKLASKALAKVALSKSGSALGGAGVGAGAGAAVGSAIPGLGTAAGAVVGGVLAGLGVGVSVDYLVLKLEESYSREGFKLEILTAIELQRAAFLKQLTP